MRIQSAQGLSEIQPLPILPMVLQMPKMDSRNVAWFLGRPSRRAWSVMKTKGVKKPVAVRTVIVNNNDNNNAIVVRHGCSKVRKLEKRSVTNYTKSTVY